MCKIKKYHGTSNTRIDECMKNIVNYIDRETNDKVIACCCGHKKYPMTIVVKTIGHYPIEIISKQLIFRTRNFYKIDEQGYYYIPEVVT